MTIPSITSAAVRARLQQPTVSAGDTPEAAPADQVSLSGRSAPKKPAGWLARTALAVALGAASLGAFTAPAQAQVWMPPPVTQSQVGISVDGHGRVGVYIGNETYNRATGVYERGGVSIGPNGVGIDYGVGVRPPIGGCWTPPRTMPWTGPACAPQTMPMPIPRYGHVHGHGPHQHGHYHGHFHR